MDLRKFNAILMRVVAVLLVLVMVSTSVVSGRYARYTTTVTGSDSARVARFKVTENTTLLNTVSLYAIPGTTTVCPLEVENDSEVAIRYTVDVQHPNTMKNFNLSYTIREVYKTDSVTYAEEKALPFEIEIAPNTTVILQLLAKWEGDVDPSFAGRVDAVSVTLKAVQVD